LFYPDLPRDYFFELCQRQAASGHRVDLVTWNKSGRSLPVQSVDGFTILRVKGPNLGFVLGFTDFPLLPGLPKAVSTLKPDIVHAEAYYFLSTLQAIETAANLKCPGIVTVHGTTLARRGPLVDLAQNVYIRTVGRRIFARANRVICLTESDAHEVVGYGCPAGKISVVPNGIDSELFRPGVQSADNLVVWDGRFVLEKGLPDLLKAARIVASSIEGVRFLLIGYGPWRPKIEQMARNMRLTPGIVEFRGPVTREEVAQILRQATVFAFPSVKEGLPLSLLEAMSTGKPVVSTRIPSIEQIISHGDNGLLVTPGDFQELALAIGTLLTDHNMRKKLGDNARRTALTKYSWNLVLRRLDDIYKAEMEALR